MSDIDLDYFVRRMCEEKEAAARASSPQVAAVHQELAQRYEAVLTAHEHPVLRDDGDPCSRKAA